MNGALGISALIFKKTKLPKIGRNGTMKLTVFHILNSGTHVSGLALLRGVCTAGTDSTLVLHTCY